MIGFTGSWAGHMARWLQGKKDKPAQPVYISKEKYKKLKELEEMEYYSDWL